ncbi:hypothetical protein [Streptomyces sp. NPDC002403]
MVANEAEALSVLARITDRSGELVTPALYGIEVDTVTESTVDEPSVFARRIIHLRLGAYTGTFRTGDVVYLSGRPVHVHGPDAHSGFDVEVTPWSAALNNGPPPTAVRVEGIRDRLHGPGSRTRHSRPGRLAPTHPGC